MCRACSLRMSALPTCGPLPCTMAMCHPSRASSTTAPSDSRVCLNCWVMVPSSPGCARALPPSAITTVLLCTNPRLQGATFYAGRTGAASAFCINDFRAAGQQGIGNSAATGDTTRAPNRRRRPLRARIPRAPPPKPLGEVECGAPTSARSTASNCAAPRAPLPRPLSRSFLAERGEFDLLAERSRRTAGSLPHAVCGRRDGEGCAYAHAAPSSRSSPGVYTLSPQFVGEGGRGLRARVGRAPVPCTPALRHCTVLSARRSPRRCPRLEPAFHLAADLGQALGRARPRSGPRARAPCSTRG